MACCLPPWHSLQEPPHLGNQWEDDVTLRQLLQHLLPPEVLAAARPDLTRFGVEVAAGVKRLGRRRRLNLPSWSSTTAGATKG